MKKIVSVLGLTFLLVVYCVTISSSFLDSSSSSLKNSGAENTLSVVSANLITPSSQAEGSLKVSCPTVFNFKNPFSEFNTIIQSTEHIIATKFFQYTFSSRNFPIQFRNIDIIFPFHYFW